MNNKVKAVVMILKGKKPHNRGRMTCKTMQRIVFDIKKLMTKH